MSMLANCMSQGGLFVVLCRLQSRSWQGWDLFMKLAKVIQIQWKMVCFLTVMKRSSGDRENVYMRFGMCLQFS